ncbi:hypothetical protein [Pseudomonas japonica]|uniref:hypothetical protein n=1 Tax=Pseudomonas japonica TaxID=256466 RepID=UPI0015E4658A|nr:hypothetical protein [Pseudomonas japonica]MBA1245868.1 hypothetical protein [Pseudomonas japonica]
MKKMSFLRKLLARLKAIFAGKELVDTHGSFPEIDLEKLKVELDIVNQARKEGERGVPDARDIRRTQTEYAIEGTVGSLRVATLRAGESWLKLLKDRLDGIDLTQEANRTIQLGDEYVRKSDAILSDADGELKEMVKTVKARKAILDQFRTDNRLPDAPPRLHGLADHIVKLSMLIVFCALESMINANFFAQGLAGGLLGGLMMALMAAGLNLVVAFFCGRGLINKNHVNGIRKAAGWIAGLFGLAWTTFAGLGVAYLRFVLPQIDDDGANQLAAVWQNMAAHISPFTDIEGVALCAITMIFGLVAMHHGYAWQDRYPGYEKVYGAYQDAFHEFLDFIRGLKAELEDEKVAALDLIELKVKTAKDSIQIFRYNMSEKAVAKKKVTERLVLADNAIQSLIQAYRYENQMARPADKPRPDYFNEPVVLSDQEFPDFGIEEDERRLRIQEQMLQQMLDILEPTRARVQSSFNAKFDQLKPLESQV